MTVKQGLNSTDKAVLETVNTHRGISRKKIAELLHLSPGMITNVSKSLIQEKYMIEGDRISSGMGRKEILLYSNADKFRFLGLDIGGYRIRFAIADNTLKILCEDQCLVSELREAEDKVDALIRKIESFLQKANMPIASIDAMGIGITGITDMAQKIILNIPNAAGWDHLDVVNRFGQFFQKPVFLDEGGRTMAMLEKKLGGAKQISDFIVAEVGHGIAAGIYINDYILRGVNNTAGLLGHVTADPNGTRCRCGNYGCLENIVTYPIIQKKYRKNSGQDIPVAEALQQNDKTALDICLEAGQAFGIALSNVVNLFNPSTIFIGGTMFKDLPVLFEETKRTILLRGNRFSTSSLSLEHTTFTDKQGIMGALCLAQTSFIHQHL
jgi:N-acetylglucosamine repressor